MAIKDWKKQGKSNDPIGYGYINKKNKTIIQIISFNYNNEFDVFIYPYNYKIKDYDKRIIPGSPHSNLRISFKLTKRTKSEAVKYMKDYIRAH